MFLVNNIRNNIKKSSVKFTCTLFVFFLLMVSFSVDEFLSFWRQRGNDKVARKTDTTATKVYWVSLCSVSCSLLALKCIDIELVVV